MHCAIIIPSLDPEEKFIDIVKGLSPSEDKPIIIVDDGTKSELLYIFDEIAKIPYCIVLHHEINRGKGRALKTAFEYCLKNYSYLDGVVTADCDGQHSLLDIMKVSEEISRNRGSIILGVRDFSSKDVPFRSWLGNHINAFFFRWFYGVRVTDTQTGLRGLPAELMEWLVTVPGERFEYEMYMLTLGMRKGIRIVSIPIQTIYINQNEGTHYKVLRDSWHVAVGLLSGLFSYAASSTVSAITDVLIFILLNTFVFKGMQIQYRLLAATVIARFTSSVINFVMNHKSVFQSNDEYKKSAPRYYLLWSVQLTASYGLTLFLTYITNINSNFSKIFIDIFLAIASYQVQMKWVFKNRNPFDSK